MRLFFVCKQFSMRRDFIADRYWRLWHLPAELARRGHQVHGLACAYRSPHASAAQEPGLRWVGQELSLLSYPSWRRWLAALTAQARASAPQAIVASSDALQLWAARRLSRALDVPLVVDFYDNYESYGASKLPLARRALREAARAAAATTFVSEPLRDFLVARYGLTAPTLPLENGVDATFLSAPGRAEARTALSLPLEARLVGTAGALDATRNIGVLYEAFLRLAADDPALHLVLAGEPKVSPPAHPRVHLLGPLAPERMPAFWAALDVATIGLRDDAFGRYCYPQKLAEICAVGTPAVFPRIGVLARGDPGAWGVAAASNDVDGMVEAVRRQLSAPVRPMRRAATWPELAARLEQWLESLPALRTGLP